MKVERSKDENGEERKAMEKSKEVKGKGKKVRNDGGCGDNKVKKIEVKKNKGEG